MYSRRQLFNRSNAFVAMCGSALALAQSTPPNAAPAGGAGPQASDRPRARALKAFIQQALLALSSVVVSLSALPSIAAAAETSADTSAEQSGENLEEIIVTGVFEPISRRESTVAISVVDSSLLKTVIPVSASDLLTNIPGIQVDSSQGEIFNRVTSRGLNSDFTMFEEDGLPVTGVVFKNYQADFVLRADDTLDRIEAVRGGSAAITGPNAPGGIFNYISKTGGDVFAGDASASYGLLGDGKLPYSRVDIDVGGPLAAGWNFNIGGFYRHDDGSEDLGYPGNFGGQLKANVTKKFENASLEVYAKLLDDHNIFNDVIPAVNFSSPTAAPGFSNTSSINMPAASFPYQTGPNSFSNFNSTQLMRNTDESIGARFDVDLGNGWSVKNNLKFSAIENHWNTTVVPYYQPLDNLLSYFFLGTLGKPGTYTLRDTATGTSAQVLSNTGFDFKVLSNTLPGSNSQPGEPNATILQVASVVDTIVHEWLDQFSVTKKLDSMSFTLGAYFDYARLDSGQNELAAAGLSTFTPKPRMLDITLQTPAGQTLQVTNPEGFTAPLNAQTTETVDTWAQESLFFAHRWAFYDKWSLDWGARYDRYVVNADNATVSSTVTTSTSNNLYNDSYVVPAGFLEVDRTFAAWSYSAAINYDINSVNSVYFRYSDGKKSPDLNFYATLNNPATNDLQPTIAQTVEQLELGYKFIQPRYNLMITPYYSDLKGITVSLLTDANGSFYQAYTPANETRNYGVEADGEFYFDYGFALRSALTWQNAKEISSYAWSQPNGGGPISAATLTNTAGNKAENIPDFLVSITPSYTHGPFLAQVQWKYVGSRPANNNNAFNLPAYSYADLTLQWRFSHGLSVAFTANNLFDGKGVVQWVPPGPFGTNAEALTRAQIQADPNAVFAILPIQARAYYLKLSYNL